MKRICAWCKKEMGARETYGLEGEITHGICSICTLEVTKDSPRTVREILGLISEPLFVVDSEGVVKAANKSASELLNKELDGIEDQLGGDAFECSYAKNESGCGNTVHCKTCAIRNIVMDTLKTGMSYKDVPAFQSLETEEGPRIYKFKISTEKVGERVLLRVDSVADAASG